MQWQVPVPKGPFTMADVADEVSWFPFHVHTVIAQDVEDARVKALAEHEAECLVRASRKGDGENGDS